jgi:hypothetical protein
MVTPQRLLCSQWQKWGDGPMTSNEEAGALSSEERMRKRFSAGTFERIELYFTTLTRGGAGRAV